MGNNAKVINLIYFLILFLTEGKNRKGKTQIKILIFSHCFNTVITYLHLLWILIFSLILLCFISFQVFFSHLYPQIMFSLNHIHLFHNSLLQITCYIFACVFLNILFLIQMHHMHKLLYFSLFSSSKCAILLSKLLFFVLTNYIY